MSMALLQTYQAQRGNHRGAMSYGVPDMPGIRQGVVDTLAVNGDLPHQELTSAQSSEEVGQLVGGMNRKAAQYEVAQVTGQPVGRMSNGASPAAAGPKSGPGPSITIAAAGPSI